MTTDGSERPEGVRDDSPAPEALWALDTAIDRLGTDPGSDTTAMTDADRRPGADPGLGDLVVIATLLRAMPAPAWDELSPLYTGGQPGTTGRGDDPSALSHVVLEDLLTGGLQPLSGASSPPASNGTGELGHRDRWRSVLLVAVVGAVTALVVAALGFAGVTRGNSGGGSGTRSSPGSVAGARVNGERWRLESTIVGPSWSEPSGAPGTTTSFTVTCTDPGTCIADDPGGGAGSRELEVTEDGGATWRAVSLPNGGRLETAPTCPTATTCLAAGFAGVPASAVTPRGGVAVLYQTTSAGDSWTEHPAPSGVAEITDLSCPSSGLCVGVGYRSVSLSGVPSGPVAMTTTGPGTAWKVSPLPSAFQAAGPSGLACGADGSCVVVGGPDLAGSTPQGSPPGSNAGPDILFSRDRGLRWSASETPPQVEAVQAVSCPSRTWCMGLSGSPALGPSDEIGPSRVLVSTDGGAEWAQPAAAGLAASTLRSISCPQIAMCWAAGARWGTSTSGIQRGLLVATHDGGRSWVTQDLPTAVAGTVFGSTLPVAGIQYVSSVTCPGVGDCVALGMLGTSGAPSERQVVLRNDRS